MSHAPGRVGRPTVTRPSSSSGVPSGVMPMPSRVVRVSFSQTSASGSSSVEPARLAQHGGGRGLPVGAVVAVLGRGQVEGALVRLELLGLVQAALDGLLLGHARRRRFAAAAGPSTVNFSMPGVEVAP